MSLAWCQLRSLRSRSLRAWSSNLFASGPADNWLALEVPDNFLLIAMGCNARWHRKTLQTGFHGSCLSHLGVGQRWGIPCGPTSQCWRIWVLKWKRDRSNSAGKVSGLPEAWWPGYPPNTLLAIVWRGYPGTPKFPWIIMLHNFSYYECHRPRGLPQPNYSQDRLGGRERLWQLGTHHIPFVKGMQHSKSDSDYSASTLAKTQSSSPSPSPSPSPQSFQWFPMFLCSSPPRATEARVRLFSYWSVSMTLKQELHVATLKTGWSLRMSSRCYQKWCLIYTTIADRQLEYDPKESMDMDWRPDNSIHTNFVPGENAVRIPKIQQ